MEYMVKTGFMARRIPNASVGFSGRPKVTIKLTEMLDAEELQAVLAHELIHAVEHHVYFLTASGLIAIGLNRPLRRKLQNALSKKDYQQVCRLYFTMLGLVGLKTLVHYVCEFRADAGARRQGHGPALASALLKITQRPGRWTMKHPSTNARIRRLSK